jgi:chromosome partitioning protein
MPPAPGPAIVAVVNPKGGSGKTTTTAYTLHALAEQGHRVLGVDADPQASLAKWAEQAHWRIPVDPRPDARLHRDLPGVVGYDILIVDTPGTDHGLPIVASALQAATHVLIPLAPTPAEYERLHSLVQPIEDAVRVSGDVELGVLFVRTIHGAMSTGHYRRVGYRDGWRVLRGSVPRMERYAQAFGQPVQQAAASGYGDAINELLGLA